MSEPCIFPNWESSMLIFDYSHVYFKVEGERKQSRRR